MPDKTIKFEIVTPEKVVLEEDISQVTVPSKEGEITVLPKHTPLIVGLKPGVIELINKKGEIRIMSISGGFIEVLRNKVVILADSADRAEELDEKEIEKAKKRAQESLKDLRHFDQERFTNISAQITRELAKTKALERWKNVNSRR